MATNNSKQQRYRSLKLPLIIGGFVLLIILVAVLELTNTTHFFHKAKTTTQTASQYTKGELQASANSPTTKNSNSQNTNGSQPGDSKNEVSLGQNTSLAAPSGNFVSDHKPNLSGSPAPNLIQSTCDTTPGAYCKVTFTKDGVTKSLQNILTDRSGAAYWTWKLQDVGLTSGSWTVKATASLNGKTSTTTDALPLDVQQ